MSTKILIDTNIYAAHEMGYPDAVEFIEQLIEDEAEIIMTTLIEMENLLCIPYSSHLYPTITKNEYKQNTARVQWKAELLLYKVHSFTRIYLTGIII
ncbi:hypothetical protein [Anoxybacillus kestanbolensis]|uniref:hypothetical protein n=1 Tax=Anoxybacillus kestanbolensis TaxID=227476 RepID=UPI003D24B335